MLPRPCGSTRTDPLYLYSMLLRSAPPQPSSPPTPLVVSESLTDVVRHGRVALLWRIVQAAAILEHEQPAFGRQPAAPLRAALVGDDNFASPDQQCVVI